MKCLLVFILIPLIFAEFLEDCCPQDKQLWCPETGDYCPKNCKTTTECYKCTPEDRKKMKKELEQFTRLTDNIRSYEKFKFFRFTVKCLSATEIYPWVVFVEDNKELNKYRLYEAHYTNLTECNNCLMYDTPTKYQDCAVSVRKSMVTAIIAGTTKILKQKLDNATNIFQKECIDFGVI